MTKCKDQYIESNISIDEYYNAVYNALVLISREKVTEWYIQFLWFKSKTQYRTVDRKILDLIFRLSSKLVSTYNQYFYCLNYSSVKGSQKLSTKLMKLEVLVNALKEISYAHTHYMNTSLFSGEMVVYAEDTVDIAKKALEDIKCLK